MKVIYGINQIKKYPNPVVALGVFDGLHRGHMNILKALVIKARGIKGASIALTFWPHPQGEESLYSLEHRLKLINEIGIDVCVVINFNKRFANIRSADFIKNILVNKLHAQHIFIGKNFRFGKDAEGDFRTLEEAAKVYNFKLRVFDVIKIDNVSISSTHIRKLIKQGRFSAAEELLARPVTILGTVIKGVSLGKRLGFPTANIDPHHEVIPPFGVYAVRVIFKDRIYYGACYIGSKPTFLTQGARANAHGQETIEVFIFNFNKGIYGKYLEVQFIKKIRNELKFSSVPALAKQIKIDTKTVKKIFSRH
jgi:riboflavin kinase / FMN adenylyltransferase